LELAEVSILIFERRVAKKDFAKDLREIEAEIQTASPGRLQSSRFPFLRRLIMLDPDHERQPAAIVPWPEFVRGGQEISPALVAATAAKVNPADVGAVFFSSGSTGLPKGIVHSHRAISPSWCRYSVVSARGIRIAVQRDPKE
jgi:fatty-acyl-CoA synthase